MEDWGTQTDPVLVRLMEDMGLQTNHGPEGEKGGEPKSKDQTPWCCKILSFLLLLMVLFCLGLCYCAWASWSATTAERILWQTTNSAITHGALLRKNGSWRPPSAIDPIFWRQKM